MSPAKINELKASFTDLSKILYTLLFSDFGKDRYIEIFSKLSTSLIKKINEFFIVLKKEKFFELSKSTTEEELRKDLDELIAKLKNPKKEDLFEIKKIVDSRYTYYNEITIEGIVLGIYDFFLMYFEKYFELIRFKYNIDKEKALKKALLNYVDGKKFRSVEGAKSIIELSIEAIAKLQEIPKNAKPEEELKIINTNKEIVQLELDPANESHLSSILGTNLKQRAKKEKAINRIEVNYESMKNDKITEFQEELFGLTEELILKIMSDRSKLISGSTQKSLFLAAESIQTGGLFSSLFKK